MTIFLFQRKRNAAPVHEDDAATEHQRPKNECHAYCPTQSAGSLVQSVTLTFTVSVFRNMPSAANRRALASASEIRPSWACASRLICWIVRLKRSASSFRSATALTYSSCNFCADRAASAAAMRDSSNFFSKSVFFAANSLFSPSSLASFANSAIRAALAELCADTASFKDDWHWVRAGVRNFPACGVARGRWVEAVVWAAAKEPARMTSKRYLIAS